MTLRPPIITLQVELWSGGVARLYRLTGDSGPRRFTAAVVLLAAMLLSGCGARLGVSSSHDPVAASQGELVNFKAEPTHLKRGCRPDYAWTIAGAQSSRGLDTAQASASFAAVGRYTASVRLVACGKTADDSTNVDIRQPANACQPGLPFDLISSHRDDNGLSLNPEWRWQCAFRGTAADYPVADEMCNDFRWTAAHSAPDVGASCTTDGVSADAPPRDNLLWYTICHFTNAPPFQEPDDTIHGHVNWRPVTYEGTVRLEQIQSGLPLGDGDVDLNLAPSGRGVEQRGTPSPPGVTARSPNQIHVEFSVDEVLQAFGDSTVARNTWTNELLALKTPPAGSTPAVVMGLFGLDVRHGRDPNGTSKQLTGSYSEIHPVYAMALPEVLEPTFSRWLIFARDGGDEGGCSQHRRIPFARGPGHRLVLRLNVASGSGARAHVSANFAASELVSIRPGAGHTLVTIDLAASGRGHIVAGELDLPTSGAGTLAPRRAPRPVRTTPVSHVPIPAQPLEPEELLRSLAQLEPGHQGADSVIVRVQPPVEQPVSAAQMCRVFGPAARAKQGAEEDSEQVHLVQKLCQATREKPITARTPTK